jgi:uncharacterized protein (DUF2062 family)
MLLFKAKPRRTVPRKKRPLKEKVRRFFRYMWLKMVRTDDSPAKVSGGVALGIFLGIIPTFGAGGPIAIFLAFVFRLNRAAAVLSSAVMNPITTPFVWTGSAWLGALVMGADFSTVIANVQQGDYLSALTEFYVVYLVGNGIIAVVLSLIGYILAYRLSLSARIARRRRLHIPVEYDKAE